MSILSRLSLRFHIDMSLFISKCQFISLKYRVMPGSNNETLTLSRSIRHQPPMRSRLVTASGDE